MRFSHILLLSFIFNSICSFSQVIDFKEDVYWIDSGIGNYFSTDDTDGFSGSLSFNVLKNKTLYELRLLEYEEFQLFGPDPNEEFYSAGILLGKGISGKYLQVLISGGLGITGGIKRGELLYTEPSGGWFNISDGRHFEKDKFITPSIPIEVDLLIKPLKYLGVGVTFYVDINYKRPMYGVIYKFGIGKLRTNTAN